MTYISTDAILDPTGTYRYLLSRVWKNNTGKVVFVMLNPSTADGTEDDPTIRRCVGFAKYWGYGGLEVVNLFALRSTKPEHVFVHPEPVGTENDAAILAAVHGTDLIVAAWGTMGNRMQRDRAVLELLKEKEVYCLATTRDGHPRHPLYVRREQEPVLYGSVFDTET
ncbi:DUF1643 domain-containing protein [Alkalicoccobacillus gibsonii]|uniref:DUF1643 domain-containing protein n=1 Tax=Alkalicoccobacillus gibsonii TaxID=79881 RepID=UPI001932490C|nr:DUF1643 domain-containing protein [Alkalicoccobacillus gibsonii]MBM0065923.1 DUF1643 domain-containing protein [Alkalicoccobacillus gibsonii]